MIVSDPIGGWKLIGGIAEDRVPRDRLPSLISVLQVETMRHGRRVLADSLGGRTRRRVRSNWSTAGAGTSKSGILTDT